MSDRQPVTIKILDREYRIACEPDERRGLLDAADYLDTEMRKLRDAMGSASMDKVAILAALNVTNDFLTLRSHHDAQEAEASECVERLKDRLNQLELDGLS